LLPENYCGSQDTWQWCGVKKLEHIINFNHLHAIKRLHSLSRKTHLEGAPIAKWSLQGQIQIEIGWIFSHEKSLSIWVLSQNSLRNKFKTGKISLIQSFLFSCLDSLVTWRNFDKESYGGFSIQTKLPLKLWSKWNNFNSSIFQTWKIKLLESTFSSLLQHSNYKVRHNFLLTSEMPWKRKINIFWALMKCMYFLIALNWARKARKVWVIYQIS